MRKGMTLLEVVVALSLSALMLIALNGVLSGLFRQKKRTAEVQHREWAYELDRVFWNDLAQARGVALNDGGLLMAVPAAMQWDKGQGSLQSVAYQLIPTGNKQYRLTRSVYLGQQPTGDPVITQTLLWEIRKATFERVDDQGNSQPLPRELGPTPRAFRYQLWIADDAKPRSNQILVR
jgi:prepilin-type N-terminal cleavage/methylation domain-containing protein